MTLTIALPKGRILKVLAPLLARAGIDPSVLLKEDRTLIRETSDKSARFLLLKPDDVPTYVEYGAADLGVCGRDVLLERESELYEPLDLGIGRCRMMVAAVKGQKTAPGDVPRVATKYPRIAAAYFARRGQQVDIVFCQGSVELAPLTGLADLIVDIVETGDTLVQNGLEVRDEITQISSVLVANRASFKLRREVIAPLLDRLRLAVVQDQAARADAAS